MKNVLTIVFSVVALLSLSCAPTASARPLSADEALLRVSSGAMKKGALSAEASHLVYTELTPQSRQTALYVFDNGRGGFMILTADDELMPVLGYSDENNFDAADIPPAMKYWLDEYARQIEYFYSHPDNCVLSAPSRSLPTDSIGPLMSTKWNQGAPYNKFCPQIDGESTLTGCVATAMAQVMKYHNYPPKGLGRNSYEWEKGGENLSYDFSSVVFDWDYMLDSYNEGKILPVQKDAVATLMLACGMSVDMSYDISSNGGSAASTASLPKALIGNFGYKDTATYVLRSRYSAINNWEQLIYDDLAAGLPVVYKGQTADKDAHAFVCDGYDGAGMFHFNWGWGGHGDGYFALEALNPLGYESEDGSEDYGFNYYQAAVVGIMKPDAVSKVYDPILLSSGSLSLEVTDTFIKMIPEGDDWWNAFFQRSDFDVNVLLGVKLEPCDENNETYYFFRNTTYCFPAADEYLHGCTWYSVACDVSSIEPGTYTVYPAYKFEDEIFPFYPDDGVTVAKAEYTFYGNSMLENAMDGKIAGCYEVYTIDGVKVTGNMDVDHCSQLAPGIYLFVSDGKCIKKVVR